MCFASLHRSAMNNRFRPLIIALSLTFIAIFPVNARTISCEEAQELLEAALSDNNKGTILARVVADRCHIIFEGDVELSVFVDLSGLDKKPVIEQLNVPLAQKEELEYYLLRPPHSVVEQEEKGSSSPLIPVPSQPFPIGNTITAEENSTKTGLTASPGFNSHHLLSLPSSSSFKHSFLINRRQLKPLPSGCYSPGVVFNTEADITAVSGLWFSDPETPGCQFEHFGINHSQEPDDVIVHPGEKDTPGSGEAKKQEEDAEKHPPQESAVKDDEPKLKPITACDRGRRPPDKRQPSEKKSCDGNDVEITGRLSSAEWERLNSLMWRLQQATTFSSSRGIDKAKARAEARAKAKAKAKAETEADTEADTEARADAKASEQEAAGFNRVENLIKEINRLLKRALRYDHLRVTRWDSYQMVKHLLE